MSKQIEDHRLFNHSGNQPFAEVLAKHVSRRDVMRGGLGLAAASMLGMGVTSKALASVSDRKPLALAFEAISGAHKDAVVVPEGYTAQVLVPWGTPLKAGDQWHPAQAMTAEQQAASVGMHHDGMAGFALDNQSASHRFVLALNNEYIDQDALWSTEGGPTNAEEGKRPAEESRTEINAHGVTLVEVQKDGEGRWTHVPGSSYNRRLTSATVMDLGGPVAGSDYVKTRFSPNGAQTRGTNNNCGNGVTPWGTYIACEENWPNIFVNTGERFIDDARIGIPTERSRYGWETSAGDVSEDDDEFARFDVTPRGEGATDDYRNEARTFGYQVEVDPYTNQHAVKRTALGRFRHEGCWIGKLEAGEPVVFYSGHDARNEYVYKFVSEASWDPADGNRPGEQYDRLAIGAKYMDKGTLYTARFNADGSGEWLPLTPTATSRDGRRLADALGLAEDDLAGVIVHTCDAADLMGATPMDRPEWATVDPASGEVYLTLTNNSQRTEKASSPTYTNDGEDIAQPGIGFKTAPTNAANPRPDNGAGHIIRWRDDKHSNAFGWEVFVFGAGVNDADNLSGLTEQNQFASPDGLWFDEREGGEGILWIQTDNGYESITQYTNDQLLAVVPSALKAGKGGGDPVVKQNNQHHIKRFAVGPNGCEVTGIFTTPDKTALFINIQHPGNWPADDASLAQDATREASGSVRPRAATVVIQKKDGGPVAV
ncbi:DUF839 domain-containing protein [Halomonas sp. ZH2S]|uniref:DUF839 domain-containing protein n=1 Tax=Vreelandella zhuhanensis TaxID=2684210 RepID=A0A7X3KQM0_9GAMM|nr:PhoX family phosphatase [Halomonas zhuhanensis]MWJ27087.1 DUF839 domain-containing protein [Halomonas zhuhanensis]